MQIAHALKCDSRRLYSPRFAWGGRPHRKSPPAKADIATAILTNVIEHLVLLLPPNKHAVLYTFVARKPVENMMFDNASNSLISPTVENIGIYSVFFNVSMFQCR